MPHEYRTTRRVEFADTDMAGIAHFANFFRWMEEVEHEFFRSFGQSVHNHDSHFGFVRMHAACDYRKPARYQDDLPVRLTVEKKTTKALHYRFEFGAPAADEASNGSTGAPIATGRLEVVCVTRDSDTGKLRSTEIPAFIADHLQVAP